MDSNNIASDDFEFKLKSLVSEDIIDYNDCDYLVLPPSIKTVYLRDDDAGAKDASYPHVERVVYNPNLQNVDRLRALFPNAKLEGH